MDKDFKEGQHFEDFAVGDRFTAAPVRFEAAMIMDFARRYDPQRFHTDPEAARATPFGGLIASGWQVCALTFGALIEAGFLEGTGMASPGLDELRWHRPVRPGDTLRTSIQVLAVRPSASRADRGYVDFLVEAHNQDGERTLSYRVKEIVARRAG